MFLYLGSGTISSGYLITVLKSVDPRIISFTIWTLRYSLQGIEVTFLLSLAPRIGESLFKIRFYLTRVLSTYLKKG